MIKFILESYSFKRILILTAVFVILLFVSSRLFDSAWGSSSYIPTVNLEDVYSNPLEYDNITCIKLKFTGKDLVAIEGNKKFKIRDHETGYEYYDTVSIRFPDSSYEKTNKIFLQFEDSMNMDSVYFVVSKSQEQKIYYNQVFYSSVKIRELNEFTEDPSEFRIENSKLVDNELLKNNDSLIAEVLNDFNSNIDNLGIAECGTNCVIFKNICDKYGVPCRLVNLQGGDNDKVGYSDNIGYPLHVVCEIFSSKHQKWYVIDPTYGFRFKLAAFNDYLNAVEISNKHTFRREDEIVQDSILLTKRSLVGKDYFKYYENVVFSRSEWKNRVLKKLASVLYGNFNYYLYMFSNNFPIVKNGFYYVGIKTFMYFFMLILYINGIMLLMMRRLFLVKKPKH
ncbi:MAG TPA: hypothetical protein PKE39_09125 [Ignavibacteria bacterium]|nr:hypothetical protein [Ignavibacteria bacterium]HMQ99172.1 hypothetical protein [Ignavibacteria bacterium]